MAELICLNVGCADTSIIRTDNEVILIDCYDGLTFKPCLPLNKNITALFITHQHYDHFKGIKYLIDNNYSVEYLIISPYQRRKGDNSVDYDEWQEFESYSKYLVSRGTKQYKPFRQAEFKGSWWEVLGIKIWMLGPAKQIAASEKRELHDASLVFTAQTPNKNKCLFTGDASDTSLNWISKNTKNMCDDILHASHHGSKEGADLEFIKKSNADYTIISTESGVYQNVPHPSALRRYENYTKKKVYRTDKDGTISFNF